MWSIFSIFLGQIHIATGCSRSHQSFSSPWVIRVVYASPFLHSIRSSTTTILSLLEFEFLCRSKIDRKIKNTNRKIGNQFYCLSDRKIPTGIDWYREIKNACRLSFQLCYILCFATFASRNPIPSIEGVKFELELIKFIVKENQMDKFSLDCSWSFQL